MKKFNLSVEGAMGVCRGGQSKSKLTLLSMSLCLVSALVQGQESQESQEIEHMVVTASGFEQLFTKAPASISIVTPEDLELRPITDFTDVIREIPGVTITNGEGRNVDISMRGMPAGYTLILIDGKRQNLNGIARNGNNNVKQSFMPPPSAIERIEVIRGPMSTLYGSDAMGGVINVITKKGSPDWAGEISANYTLQEESEFGNGKGLSFYLSGPIYSDKIGVQISGREQFRQEDNVERGEPERTNRNLSGRMWFKPSEDHEFLLEKSHEYFNMYALVTGRRAGTLWEQTTRRDAWSLSYNGSWDIGDTRVLFQKEDAVKASNDANNWTLDAKMVSPWDMSGSHVTTLGMQFTSNEVNNWNIETVEGSVIDVITQKNQAFFVEDEWMFTDDWTLTLGMRYDSPDDFDSHISPRAYLVYSATENLTIKGGIATGFKAPRADYVAPGLVTESQDADTGALSYTYANAEMEPETSVNYEIAAIWEGFNQSLIGLTLFRTEYKDKLDSVGYLTVYEDDQGDFIVGDTVDPNGYCADAMDTLSYACSWSRRVNIDSAWSHGVELSMDMPLTDSITWIASYTWLDSEEETGDNAGQPLSGSPHHKFVTTLRWSASDNIQAWASYNFRSRLRASNRPAPGCFADDACPSLGLLDTGATYRFSDSLRFNLGIHNLFNREWSDYNTKGSVEDGRRLFLRGTYTF